jgi:hypothetical protein
LQWKKIIGLWAFNEVALMQREMGCCQFNKSKFDDKVEYN